MYRIIELNREGEFQSYVRTLKEAKDIFDYLSRVAEDIRVINEDGQIVYLYQKKYALFS